MREPTDKSLKYLTDVIDKGSIRGAAEASGVEPSVVSRNIAQLESQLGVLLFERRGRHLIPTEAARLVVRYGWERAAHNRALRTQIDELGNLDSGAVRIMAGDGFIDSLIAKVIGPFHRAYPKIELTLLSGGSQQTVQAVAEERVDLGIALAAPASSLIDCLQSWPQPIRLICAPDHPAAALDESVTLKALQGINLAIPLLQTGNGAILRQAADAEGIVLNPAFLANSIGPLKWYAASGLGATFLSELAVMRELKEGVVVSRRISNMILENCRAQLLIRKGRYQSKAMTQIIEAFGRAYQDVARFAR